MKVKNFVKLLSAIWTIGAINAFACPVVTLAQVNQMVNNEAAGHGTLHQNIVPGNWDATITWFPAHGNHPPFPANNVGIPIAHGAVNVQINTVTLMAPHIPQQMGGHNFCAYNIGYQIGANGYQATLNLRQ